VSLSQSIRTFVNVTLYPQYNNSRKEIKIFMTIVGNLLILFGGTMGRQGLNPRSHTY
jgi:hypothetical protein